MMDARPTFDGGATAAISITELSLPIEYLRAPGDDLAHDMDRCARWFGGVSVNMENILTQDGTLAMTRAVPKSDFPITSNEKVKMMRLSEHATLQSDRVMAAVADQHTLLCVMHSR